MLALSKHFIENWRHRIGNEPTVDIVQQIMQEGVIVQRARMLQDLEGRPFKMLGIYWDPALNVIISIDEFKGRAVSVLTGNNSRA